MEIRKSEDVSNLNVVKRVAARIAEGSPRTGGRPPDLDYPGLAIDSQKDDDSLMGETRMA